MPSQISFEVSAMLSLVRKQPRQSSVSPRHQTTAPRRVPPKPLSCEEVSEVNRATFREGYNHCRWPKEVIEKFLTVQV
jgi:hypothetical protein